MNRPCVVLLALLVTLPAFAVERYVPLQGGGTSVTRLSMVNVSKGRATVSVEVLGASAAAGTWTLEAGERAEWSYGDAAPGAVEVRADARIAVTATAHCVSSGASRKVPVVDRRDVRDEGLAASRGSGGGWKEALFAVNTGDVPAFVAVGERWLEVPARGTRSIDIDGALGFRALGDVLLFHHTSNERTGAAFFRPVTQALGPTNKRRAVRFPAAAPPPEPETVVLAPSKDNTLYEDSDELSNGAGIHMFAGATAGRALRRALLAFDVAAQIPPGARITRASLVLRVSLTIAGPEPAHLHNVLADWGEGASNAGSSGDGQGTEAQPGDATWGHTFFPDRMWARAGGDFAEPADGTGVEANGAVTWDSSAALAARVQSWLDHPAANFGWIVRGNESTQRTAKRLHSREGAAASRPALTIEFTR
ncbi:MAG TPA: DNRLRE domain-containing protein [Thermoanaerobaculia bacterium]|nr:DNRLRE domain-containing protein [Thermoanaerobaculia bacterium]